MSLDIKPFETNKNKIKVRPLMLNRTIPSFPESIVLVGASGSGKTTLLLRLLLEKHFYGGYYNHTFLFAVTANMDDQFKVLKIPERHTYTTEQEMIDGLDEILSIQKKIIEKKGVEKSSRICLIFEDLTANKKLMNSQSFLQVFVQGRHLNLQVICCVHKYKILPRTQRLNLMNLFFFRASVGEMNQVAEDHCPPGYTTKEMMEVLKYATDGDHNFLYINMKEPFKTRYRKNLDTVLELNK